MRLEDIKPNWANDLTNQNWDEALRIVDEALGKQPADDERSGLFLVKGMTYACSEQHHLAVKQYVQAIRLDDSNAIAWLSLSDALGELNKPKWATICREHARKVKPQLLSFIEQAINKTQ